MVKFKISSQQKHINIIIEITKMECKLLFNDISKYYFEFQILLFKFLITIIYNFFFNRLINL